MDKKAVRVAYGEALVKLGEENEKVVVLDADLAGATMTNGFKKAYPNRFYDCGIAEANMVDVAAGMSTMGLIPFCSTFAVFAGRNYDQIRNGVCYPKFNVKFGFSHAGITLGEDGGSHQAIEDIALMRVLPGMTVFVPSDANECYQCVEAAAKEGGVIGIFPQGTRCPGVDPETTKPKDGVAMLSYRTNSPVLPAFIVTKGRKLRPFRKTTVVIGKPIKPEELMISSGTPSEYKAATELIWSRICDLEDKA